MSFRVKRIRKLASAFHKLCLIVLTLSLILPCVTAMADEPCGIGTAIMCTPLEYYEDADSLVTLSDEGFSQVNSSGIGEAAVSYDYEAGLYGTDYPGVYTATLQPNNVPTESAQTIGMPSIADQNLKTPTLEPPAIIQGAAFGFEEKTGPVDYKTIKERVEPYTKFRYNIVEETGTDGTVHRKLTGFDGTYIITRLNVASFFEQSGGAGSSLWLHMKQENNRAVIPGAGMTDDGKGFADSVGTKTGAYQFKDLLDKSGIDTKTPYLDVLVFATAANVAGADAGKTDMPNGDIPLHLYVDETGDYNPSLVYDPQSTDPNHTTQVLAKFYDATKVAADQISNYLIKGSDLALETAVENGGGQNKDTGTTYWSLKKSLEDPYYDLPEDVSPADSGCGRTVKLISEVAVTSQLTLQGTDANHLKKRTLDVNSFDIQVANNTTTDQQTYSDGFTLKNAWLKIADKSNTTGAEMAIGNNARFIIDNAAKLIIDATCQLEIEWDGSTTTPAADGSTPTAAPDILNNGQLDLRAGGEIENNGIISIEGYEGKPVQQDDPNKDAVINSEKGCGEMTIREGATLTNNGALIVNGKLFNLGKLVNNGKFSDLIVSNDPDKGQIAYHKGIQISWKDDVTQKNVKPGALYNGADSNGKVYSGAVLENNGDIVLVPGLLQNWQKLLNNHRANIYAGIADEAIIPIVPDPATPTIVTKRITLNPPVASVIENYGSIINNGSIAPASVALNDNITFGALRRFGKYPGLFSLVNKGTVMNNFFIYGWPNNFLAEDGTCLYLYADKSFEILFKEGPKLTGSFDFEGDQLVFTPDGDARVELTKGTDGAVDYTFTAGSGQAATFRLTGTVVSAVREALENTPGTDPIVKIRASL